MTIAFRPFLPSDREHCIHIFCSNIPRYFREHERAEFEEFIDAAECPYFVVEQPGRIVGCGGYGVRDGSALADLCWGMIDSEFHGRHHGEYLLLARLNEIVNRETVEGVRLATCQLTDGFFQKYGFAVQSRVVDGIDQGLDNVEMRLNLNEVTRRRIAESWSKAV